MTRLALVLAVLALTGCAQLKDALGGKIGIGAEFMGARVDLSYDTRPIASLVIDPVVAGTDAVGITKPEPAPPVTPNAPPQ